MEKPTVAREAPTVCTRPPIGNITHKASIAGGKPVLNWRTALGRFRGRVRALKNSSSDLVLKLFFRPDGEPRRVVESLAETFGVDAKWGWAFAPQEECLLRLKTEVGGHDSAERSENRLSFICSAQPVFFLEGETETLERLAALAGGPAHHWS
eukprot:jgi/Undpi1/3554/HiC_scaffold_16.g06926.m1